MLCSLVLWPFPWDRLIPVAAQLGYGGIECWAFHVDARGENPARLARLLKAHDLACVVHAYSWDLNPTSHVAAIRQASEVQINRSLAMAGRLGARLLVVHPGARTVPGEPSDLYHDVQCDFFSRLARRAQGDGITVAVENMEPLPRELIVLPDQVNRLLADVNEPNLASTLDLAHIPLDQSPIPYLQTQRRIAHVHLSDVSSGRFHLPLGEGERDWVPVLRELASRYSGFVTLEGMGWQASTDLARGNKRCWDAWIARLVDGHDGDQGQHREV